MFGLVVQTDGLRLTGERGGRIDGRNETYNLHEITAILVQAGCLSYTVTYT